MIGTPGSFFEKEEKFLRECVRKQHAKENAECFFYHCVVESVCMYGYRMNVYIYTYIYIQNMAASRLSLLDKPPLRKLGAVAVSHLSLGGF